VHEPNEAESHSGVLRSTEHHAAELFEFGGQKLLLKGTSGPQTEPSRPAEGKPIRHDVVIAGQPGPAPATSGASQVEVRTAAGRPVRHAPASQDPLATTSPGPRGSGQLIGQPVRRV
jgi:hypothetical protein